MKKWWWLLLLAFSGVACADEAMTSFTQDVNYVAVTPAQPTDVKPGQIEVIEFYWYGCPHCFALEPFIVQWEKTKPRNVVFKRVPAAMKDSEFYVDAQATVTADLLGIGDKVREPFFKAIHVENNEALRTDKDAIRSFFGKFGVSPKDFDATWDSFGVQTQLARDQQLAARYNVSGVPSVIVDGKWMTGAGYQMSPDNIMRCIEFLIAKDEAAIKPAPVPKKHK
jgi:thiol:disulfide interchange protein DsbA